MPMAASGLPLLHAASRVPRRSSENDAEPADGALAAHLHLLAARVLDRRGEGLVLDVEADVPDAELDARHALVGRAGRRSRDVAADPPGGVAGADAQVGIQPARR